MLHFLKLMLQLVLSPLRGWEDVAISAGSPRHTLTHGLIPLAALAAITAFSGLFYDIKPSVGLIIIQAVISFVKYLAAYFIAVAALTTALPSIAIEGFMDRARVEIFCAYSVGLMAMMGILQNLLPMELSLLQFLPLYYIIVMCIGRTYLDVDEKKIFRFVIVDIISIILPVYLIDYILNIAG